jgi:glycosyltransferase involved in cell wall biosynthesis
VDNSSTDNTAEEIKKTSARYILETEQGYGSALIRGMKESSSDIIITCEPDLTFSHLDTYKFLVYLEDFDCVFGTRTSKSMIGVGSKMYSYLRYGNIIVAKLLGYLFFGPSLTDVGCSYKAFKSKSIKNVIHKLTVKGSHFQPELMIRLIESKNKIVEIPVYYLRRSGYSKITYSFYSSLRVALNMIKIILFLYLKKLFKR